MPFCDRCGVNATWRAFTPGRPQMSCQREMGHEGPHQMTDSEGVVIEWEEEICPHDARCDGCTTQSCIQIVSQGDAVTAVAV